MRFFSAIKWLVVTAGLMLFCDSVQANGLVITNGEVLDQDVSQNTVAVKFDLNWQNSWKDGVNHDAAWVFMKYSDDDGKTWKHATLALSGTNPSGFYKGDGTPLELVVPQDLKGMFVRKTSSGIGPVAGTGLRLVWDYGLDSVDPDKILSSLVVKVYAVEMVYVPQGAFYAGDTAAAASFRQGSADSDPWYISGAGPLQVSNAASDGFYYASSGYLGEDVSGSAFTLAPFYPNGFNGFYAMKYEVTEGEWTSFFNTLTDAQKVNRDITSASGKNTDTNFKRNTVSWSGSKATSSREDRACNYLSWQDGAAFADWAGLRPMTELEFEKAARGAATAPVVGEFAWGTASASAASGIMGTENGSEVANSGANSIFNNTTFTGGDGDQGPVRSGIFATQAAGRAASGAGFYGSMELSGNVAERVVTIGNAQGRAFAGTHGDGLLSPAGFATNSDWPGYSAGEITDAQGSGIRGGSWSDPSDRLKVSDRQEASQPVSVRQSRLGFRAVRTTP